MNGTHLRHEKSKYLVQHTYQNTIDFESDRDLNAQNCEEDHYHHHQRNRATGRPGMNCRFSRFDREIQEKLEHQIVRRNVDFESEPEAQENYDQEEEYYSEEPQSHHHHRQHQQREIIYCDSEPCEMRPTFDKDRYLKWLRVQSMKRQFELKLAAFSSLMDNRIDERKRFKQKQSHMLSTSRHASRTLKN